MTTDWLCKHHTDLGKEQLYAILKLRSEVFIVEQRCVYQDVDGQDLIGDTLHLMGWHRDQLVAYARVLDPESQGGDVVIGRVIISLYGREHKLGQALIAEALENIEMYWPGLPVLLSAQVHFQPFYEQHGFCTEGKIYLKDDIPHISLRRV